jgi:sucrose-6-phosphate hydrolase SacC (GH32 family)
MFVDRRQAGFSEIAGYAELHAAPLAPRGGRVKLRLLVDHSSIELFGGDGEAVITETMLPDPVRAGLQAFSTGGSVRLVSLDIYPLGSIWRSDDGD